MRAGTDLDDSEAAALEHEHEEDVEGGDEDSPEERQAEEQLQRDRGAHHLGDVGRGDRNLTCVLEEGATGCEKGGKTRRKCTRHYHIAERGGKAEKLLTNRVVVDLGRNPKEKARFGAVCVAARLREVSTYE